MTTSNNTFDKDKGFSSSTKPGNNKYYKVSDSPSFTIRSSDELRTKPEYARYAYDLYPLKKDEYDSLKADIASNGRICTPLSINKEGVILDGHHRFKIGLEVEIKEFLVMVQEFEDPLDELAFVIRINVLGRQLNDFQKAELGHELEKIEAERAKKRQIANLKNGKEVPLASNEANGEGGKTAEKVAKKIGVSTATYKRAKKIIQEAPEHLKQKVKSGKTSITYAYKSVMRTKDHKAENVPKLPEAKNEAEKEAITIDVDGREETAVPLPSSEPVMSGTCILQEKVLSPHAIHRAHKQ